MAMSANSGPSTVAPRLRWRNCRRSMKHRLRADDVNSGISPQRGQQYRRDMSGCQDKMSSRHIRNDVADGRRADGGSEVRATTCDVAVIDLRSSNCATLVQRGCHPKPLPRQQSASRRGSQRFRARNKSSNVPAGDCAAATTCIIDRTSIPSPTIRDLCQEQTNA